MNALINYLKNSREELAKVSWPSRQVTIKHTFMVIGVSLAVAVFLGAIYLVLTKILELIV